ncbi:hypothetical protein, partial [Actinophytocola sp.]|uniref:hypothetical protein n=1 Tax=Actinophytocola sp. TaxID=1872138 RepID=UPI0025B8CCF1
SAVLSPLVGRLTDRGLDRWLLVAMFVSAVCAAGLLALAPSYSMVLLAESSPPSRTRSRTP